MTTTRTCVSVNAESEVRETYAQWCFENIDQNDWWVGFCWSCIYFVCEQDATAFKLRFKL
jgi:hypothetical protein